MDSTETKPKTAIEIKPHLSYSQYSDFVGTLGKPGCEAYAIARTLGEYDEEKTVPMLVGSYVDAHFEGTLDVFKAQNTDLFTKQGKLKSTFVKADEIIERIERDEYLMACLAGEKQVEMEEELFGVPWKIRIDSYHKGKAIVDLKVMKSITDSFWVKDYGKTTFVEFWGHDLQGAVYQAVVKKRTGDSLPFLIAAASKEKETDIEVIGFDQGKLDDVFMEIEGNIPRILAVKRGEEKPERCGKCDYCKHTKVLTKPLHYSELFERIK